MIQDIDPHIFSNRFSEIEEIAPDDLIFYYREGMLMMKKNIHGPDIPRYCDFAELSDNCKPVFLFSINKNNCYLLQNWPDENPEKYTFEEINFVRTYEKKEIAWVSLVAYQLMNWYHLNQFCGKCGTKTVLKSDERAIICNHCETTVYPKISPAVIVAITCKNKILLARGKNFRSNFFSLVAGYVDIGESLENTVMREVKEEVGIDVWNIRYYKSQPWPFSGSMMIGFWAEADDSQPITIDEHEITDAFWFERGKLPNHPPNMSIAGEMIELFEKAPGEQINY
jgi:NAD+ diphosphatase